MNQDMSVKCDDGFINIRVGAIIIKDGKYLMIGNQKSDYLYSIGGRVKFKETARQAIIREVFEETGVKMEIDRLGFIHENYFYGDSPAKLNKLVYEISFFFYMKVPNELVLKCDSYTENNYKEYLKWVSFDDNQKVFPVFFKTHLKNPKNEIQHIITNNQ